jgi:RND superfamily putative drug exporter
MPVPGNREPKGDAAEPTTALPAMRPEGNDSDAATEKMNTRGQGDHGDQSDNGDTSRPRRRAGGGLSAQDLLRREGRL